MPFETRAPLECTIDFSPSVGNKRATFVSISLNALQNGERETMSQHWD